MVTKKKKTAEIKLPGKKADDIEILLQVLHLFQPVDDENVSVLLHFSDEYDMRELRSMSSLKLATTWARQPEKCLEALVLAYQFKLVEVAAEAWPICARNSTDEVIKYGKELSGKVVGFLWKAHNLLAASALMDLRSMETSICNLCSIRNGSRKCQTCFKFLCGFCVDWHPTSTCCKCRKSLMECKCTGRNLTALDPLKEEFLQEFD